MPERDESGGGIQPPAHWVKTTFNSGQPGEFTVVYPPGYTLVTNERYYRLNEAVTLLDDLDRSAAGRHRGDSEFQDPSGTSQGNPLLPPGTHIGHTIYGRRIVVPEKGLSVAKNWIEEARDAQ